MQNQQQSSAECRGGPETKSKRILVDSRDRDPVAFPTPSEYEVRLPDDIENVTSIKLLVADVPFPAHLVGEGDATLALTRAPAGAVSATLEAGDYASGADLTAALQAALDQAAGGPGVFLALHSQRTDTISIRCTDPFAVSAELTSPRLLRVLGFAAGRPSASVESPASVGFPHVVRAPFRLCLEPERYLVLNLTPSAEVLMSSGQGAHRAFAVLQRRCGAGAAGSLAVEEDAVFERTWSIPLARVAKIGVRFTDYYGRLYDFQNQDHRLEFMVTSVPFRKYMY
jgi:hypothetical protein